MTDRVFVPASERSLAQQSGMAIKVASEPQDLEWPPKLLPSGESGDTTSDNFLQMTPGIVCG